MKNLLKYVFVPASIVWSSQVYGQEMTFNHDESKMQQVLVMEMGRGSLTPQAYYELFQNNYQDEVSELNNAKNFLRMEAHAGSLSQIALADSIKSRMESRAEIEASNIADREVDVVWLTMGDKLENKLDAFIENITAMSSRVSPVELSSWTQLAQTYTFAIKTTHAAYLPNSERQRQYLAIYDEIVSSNEQLLSRLRYLATRDKARAIVSAMSRTDHQVAAPVEEGFDRWREVSMGNDSRRNNH